MNNKRIPKVLVIAGSDSGGGAGIQADLKTLNSIGVFGMSAITSLTAQNTKGVYGTHNVPAEFLRLQIRVCVEDIGVDAVKTGMIPTKALINIVAEQIKNLNLKNFILDPVMRSKSKTELLRRNAQKHLVESLFPLALIITPNRFEAEVLTGRRIFSDRDIKRVLFCLKDYGSKYVLLKGGHLVNGYSTDYLFDGKKIYTFQAKRIQTKNTHGTGCTYASAIAGYIAKGEEILNAVRKAKRFVTGSIKHSLSIGEGIGPVNHFWKVKD